MRLSGLLVPWCAESANFGANFQAVVVFETRLQHLETAAFRLDGAKRDAAKTQKTTPNLGNTCVTNAPPVHSRYKRERVKNVKMWQCENVAIHSVALK